MIFPKIFGSDIEANIIIIIIIPIAFQYRLNARGYAIKKKGEEKVVPSPPRP